IEAEASRHPRLELLFDPQTAGGFLAGVPEARSEDFLGRLQDANVEAVRIGTVVPRSEDGAVATIRSA
ncbi:MAG: hypothetical protein OXP70_06755, partial [Acidobacteriota bacterium]|nr:hypothetical protein [Acidobacteriota bacterium]